MNKAQYDALPAYMKALFVVNTAGEYVPLAEDPKKLYQSPEDVAALKRAKDRESTENSEAKTRAAELQAELDKINGNDARKAGDIDRLEKGWEAKYAAKDKEHAEALAAKDVLIDGNKTFIKKTLLDSTATKIAAELAGDKSDIIMPHISSRLTVDFEGDIPTVKILDKEGKLSVATNDDLKKEFVANKSFSSILVASKADGGGAPTNASKPNSNSATNFGGQDEGTKSMRDMNVKEKVAAIKAKKEAQN